MHQLRAVNQDSIRSLHVRHANNDDKHPNRNDGQHLHDRDPAGGESLASTGKTPILIDSIQSR